MSLPRLLIGSVMLTIAGCASTLAQGLSSKPIRIIVEAAPGAGADFLSRIAGKWLSGRTGLSVLIDNRGGASGTIALEAAVKAEPDGHTLLVATNGAITINRALSKKGPIDTLSDLVPIAPLGFNPDLLVINARMPVQTAQEFIALARSQPGRISYGSTGQGSTPHLALVLFARLAGIDLVHVPYRGMALAVTDLIAGNIQAAAIGNGTAAPFVESGAARILAVAAHRRLSYLPDVPDADQVGLPAWEVETWYGLFAPRGTPKPVIDRLNADIAALLDDPVNKKRLDDNFYDSKKMSADAFAAFVKAEAAKWEHVVKDAGLEPQ
jgi:tripartite-type tricarboxylate transporter receptor subunit TctC